MFLFIYLQNEGSLSTTDLQILQAKWKCKNRMCHFFLRNTNSNSAVDFFLALTFHPSIAINVSLQLRERFSVSSRVSPWLMAVTARTETGRPPLHATRSICPPSWERSLRPGSSPSGKSGVDKAWHSASRTTVMWNKHGRIHVDGLYNVCIREIRLH